MQSCPLAGQLFGTRKTKETPGVQHVEVVFVPPMTAARIQPVDAGMIAAMKRRYRKLQVSRTLHVLMTNASDMYKVDRLTAMKWICEI